MLTVMIQYYNDILFHLSCNTPLSKNEYGFEEHLKIHRIDRIDRAQRGNPRDCKFARGACWGDEFNGDSPSEGAPPLHSPLLVSVAAAGRAGGRQNRVTRGGVPLDPLAHPPGSGYPHSGGVGPYPGPHQG